MAALIESSNNGGTNKLYTCYCCGHLILLTSALPYLFSELIRTILSDLKKQNIIAFIIKKCFTLIIYDLP